MMLGSDLADIKCFLNYQLCLKYDNDFMGSF